MLESRDNKGDLRLVDIDYEGIAQKTSPDFVEFVRKIGDEGKSGRRGITFMHIRDSEEYYCVYLSSGFYSEKHNLTVHHEIHYLQFNKARQSFLSENFAVRDLEIFSSIGITVTE